MMSGPHLPCVVVSEGPCIIIWPSLTSPYGVRGGGKAAITESTALGWLVQLTSIYAAARVEERSCYARGRNSV